MPREAAGEELREAARDTLAVNEEDREAVREGERARDTDGLADLLTSLHCT